MERWSVEGQCGSLCGSLSFYAPPLHYIKKRNNIGSGVSKMETTAGVWQQSGFICSAADWGAAPWPGARRSQEFQEESSWCIQALGSQAPKGLRIPDGDYDNSSCTWLRWVHQALHLGDRCQPWRAQRHPVPGTGWEVKSDCLCQPAPPTQWEKQFTLQQHEAGISCHEMGNNGQIPALLVGREVQGHHRQQSADLLSLREIRRVRAKMGLTARTVRFWHPVQTWKDQPCWCPFPHAPRTLS